MFFSRLSKIVFILILLTSLACDQPTTVSNSSSTPQNNNPTTVSTPTTSPIPNASPAPTSTATTTPTPQNNEKIKDSDEPVKVSIPESELRKRLPAPGELTDEERRKGQLLADRTDNSRALIRYYNFLTDIRGLNLNPPKDLIGGASAFKANDVLQFTFKEPQVAVLIAQFIDPQNQKIGIGFMQKLTVDDRKYLQVKNYSLLVKGGNEKIYKVLTDAIDQFDKVQ
ncbi:MAG: hypothetical protein IPK14_22520 [Blastocatellia bacterium]|nr:hypothetical protein [Blastocatellia bacterium]MBL8195290.1 hypothetical protein [Blastocatellia bacterium]MBN8723137.1 hypothetical protein [Acidobacteriota bacterium]